MAFGLLDPIDVIIVHDLMMLVLSCHAHVFCPSIIRIALRLLLPSVTSGPPAIAILLAVTLIVYRICQIDGTNIDPVDCSPHEIF